MTVPGTKFFILFHFSRGKKLKNFFVPLPDNRLALSTNVLFESHFTHINKALSLVFENYVKDLRVAETTAAAAAEQYLMTHKTREREKEREREEER